MMNMTSKYNPYQVICIGDDCKGYGKCGKSCILKSKFKNRLKGCNYSKKGDCTYCSNRNRCVLLKPFSNELHKIEIKRISLELENKKLYEYISEWDEIEEELEEYGVDSVTDVIYFERNKQQMVDRINDNKKLISAYLKKEKSLIKDM